jgi:uncharacterized protein (UPF0335 family)
MTRKAKPDPPAAGDNSGPVAADRLRSLVERIERLNGEKAELVQDIKEIFKEAESAGYPVKALRAIIKERAEDVDKLAQLEADKDMLRAALGGMADLPLGTAALAAAIA